MEVEQEPIEIRDSEDEAPVEPEPVEEDPDKIKESGNTAFKATEVVFEV